ncbi:MAG TPA: AAA family ATPase [Candidatus Megaira endosymbiont of Nemacystus decipiens]|nr:AAA family ATPase [Candidatus Megaera endosymbiont of Nemacystus decipiens]
MLAINKGFVRSIPKTLYSDVVAFGVPYFAQTTYRHFNTPTGEKPSILVGSGNFRKLVLGSTLLVDKTELIKKVEEQSNEVMLFTYPRRWGKTTNLTMLKEFYQLNTPGKEAEILMKECSSKELFTGGEAKLSNNRNKQLLPLKISQHQHIMQQQGTRPLIYIDLKDVPGSSYQNALDGLKKAVYLSFNEHSYLLNSKSIDSGAKDVLEKLVSANSYHKTKDLFLKDSLRMLSELLYNHHGKKVLVLIDEYDSAINKAYINRQISNDDIDKIIELYRDFLSPALKSNIYLEKALLTGIFKLAKANIFSGLNNMVTYDMSDLEYSKYYGFTQEEVEYLLTAYSVDLKTKEAIKGWYNGYNAGGLEIYNPWSVVNALRNYQVFKEQKHSFPASKYNILKSYWSESGNVNFITPLLKHKSIKNKIEQLIKGEAIYFNFKSELSVTDYAELKNMINLGLNYEINNNGINVLFSYLTYGGYLTRAKNSILYTLPNKEIQDDLRDKILEHYNRQYNIDTNLFLQVTDQLQLILEAKSQEDYTKIKSNFTLALTKIFEQAPPLNKVSRDKIELQPGVKYWLGNEDLLHSILSYTVLQLKDISQFATEVYLGDGRADLLYLDEANKKAVILELKFDDSDAKAAIKQIHTKNYAKPIPIDFEVVNVGVNLDMKKALTVEIEKHGQYKGDIFNEHITNTSSNDIYEQENSTDCDIELSGDRVDNSSDF